jgi:cytochrome o ubiquinol oxidase subunit 3
MESKAIIESIEGEEDSKIFGFWMYLMTDLVIFAVLFALFAVLHKSTYGGPTGHDLFHLPSALAETLILLTSSFTCSLAMIQVHQEKRIASIFWFAITFALGVAFLTIEIAEFAQFIHEGASWQRSAFLSSFFTLVGTHGLHITVGLLWMAVAMYRIWLRPLVEHNHSQIFRMALFWHFLDFVWIFIFTVVYGIGYLS